MTWNGSEPYHGLEGVGVRILHSTVAVSPLTFHCAGDTGPGESAELGEAGMTAAVSGVTAQAADLLLFETRLKEHHDYYIAVQRRYIALCVALSGANVYHSWQWVKALELQGRVCWSSTACSLAVFLVTAICFASSDLRTQARVCFWKSVGRWALL